MAFEKFPQADPTLTTQMKSVGEAMAIGRTFKESLQKCLRSLEIGRSGLGGDGKPWRIGTEVYGDRDILPRDVISRKLSVPFANPNGIPASSLATVRAGQARSAYPGKPFPKFINSEGVESNPPPPRPKRRRAGALQDASRQPSVIVNAPASWTAVALRRFSPERGCVPRRAGSAAARSQHTLQNIFNRLPPSTLLRLVLRTLSRSVRKLRQERNLCSHPRHPIPQTHRGGIFRS